jgi:hypothetical protein
MNNIADIPFDVTLKFDEAVTQHIGSFQRVFGLVRVKQLVGLIQTVDLDSNPRNARAGSITADIMESLERYPEIFPLMSKGILLSAVNFRKAERDRYQLRFEDKSIEGVLDGGHNLLALGLYILGEALSEAAVTERLGPRIIFSEFKSLFQRYFTEIDAYLMDPSHAPMLDRFVPVELLLPVSDSDANQLAFRDALPLIQQARNNNAQLKAQALADHAGIFEELKKVTDPKVRSLIEWKTNDGGVVDVRDLIALAWIVLPELDFDAKDEAGRRIAPPAPPQLYSGKATVLNRYVEFMESADVGHRPPGGRYELRNPLVASALQLTKVLPALFEQVCELAEKVFDESGSRTKFRALTVVEAANKRGEPTHKFSKTGAPIAVPDGFVWPVVAGFRALIERDSDGVLRWGTDPILFLHDHWQELSSAFFSILESGQFDPQKVGKSRLSYELLYSRIDGINARNK